jgi:hypothetical protein
LASSVRQRFSIGLSSLGFYSRQLPPPTAVFVRLAISGLSLPVSKHSRLPVG